MRSDSDQDHAGLDPDMWIAAENGMPNIVVSLQLKTINQTKVG